MKLYQKIDMLLEYYNFSRMMLAKKINISKPTFNRYFSDNHEDKLRACLWQIYEVFPTVSRNWLFFDEGEMFTEEKDNNPEIDKLQKKIDNLELELSEERKINRQLTAKLLIDSNAEKDTLTKRSA